jgi:hypothetical protein
LEEEEKNLILKAIREEELKYAQEARADAFQVPPGTPRIGAFSEDSPGVHLKYRNPEERGPEEG